MRGISPILSAVFMTLIAVALATVTSGWLSSFSSDTSASLKNTTKTQLECQFADMFIKNASYNCAGDCAAGKTHNLTVTLVNSGKISLTLDKIYIENKTGSLFALETNQTGIAVGATLTLRNVSTDTCNGINKSIEKIIISSPACPGSAYDSIKGEDVNFVNC